MNPVPSAPVTVTFSTAVEASAAMLPCPATFSSVTVPAGRMPMSLNKPSTVVDRDLDSSNLAGNVPA